MPIHNADIAAIFERIADLLEIRSDNPFRIRAYRNAARAVGGFGQDIKSLFDRGRELPKLPGIGADLNARVHEITATGTCGLLERLHKEFPSVVTELLKLPGLGPKRVKTLYDKLQVRTMEELHYFTGSKAHNIVIRRLGQDCGLKINEYGVFRGETRIAGETEASVYEAVGLPFIAPELREDRGEIEAARRGELPRLVTLEDLKGDLHLHSAFDLPRRKQTERIRAGGSSTAASRATSTC